MVLEVIIRNLNRILTVMVIIKSEFYPGEGQHLIDADKNLSLKTREVAGSPLRIPLGKSRPERR